MTRPTKHPKSGVYRIRIAVPPSLRDIIERDRGRRVELVETLGTKDAAEAKRLAPPVVAKFEGWIRAAEAEHRGSTVRLTDRDVSAWCGRWLAHQEAEYRDHLPSTADDLDTGSGILVEIIKTLDGHEDGTGTLKEALDHTRGALLPLMAAQGVVPDHESLRRLADKFVRTSYQWHLDMERRHRTGQWRASVTSADFPALATTPAPPTAGAGCSMDALLTGWAADRGWRMDAKPVPRPLYDRLRTVDRLAVFVGHRDASRVTKADAVRWKEDMQARSLHASTIRNDLSECSAVWAWGIRQGKLSGPENPFAGISPPKSKKQGTARRAFTDTEAAAVLTAARSERGWRRWLPWVLCLTGARLAEVMQSDRADVATIDGVTVLRLHEDGPGRSLKNTDSRRIVPIHPALAAEGFLAYVAALPAGSPLFPDVAPDQVFGTRAASASKLFSRWLRGRVGIKDPTISPAHSFRHWWIDAARRVVMPPEVRSAITGHSARLDESAGYGRGMGSFPVVLAEHMARVELPEGLADVTVGAAPAHVAS